MIHYFLVETIDEIQSPIKVPSESLEIMLIEFQTDNYKRFIEISKSKYNQLCDKLKIHRKLR